MINTNTVPTCSVTGCNREAHYQVLFEDLYVERGRPSLYREPHIHCQFICQAHMEENEQGIIGTVEPRGCVEYPHTRSNGQGAAGYRRLSDNSIHSPMLDSARACGWDVDRLQNQVPTTHIHTG